MKNIFKTIVACLSATCIYNSAPAADLGYDNDPFFSDMALINCGDDPKRAAWTEEDFEPYLTHKYSDGHEDWLFDCFLLVDTHHGSKIFGNDISGTPATKADMNWMLNQFFDPELKLHALDDLIDKKKETLGEPRLPHRVVLSLCLPTIVKEDGKWPRTAWGRLGRLNINTKTLERRMQVMRWYIDEMVSRFENENYRNLTLAGVYWVEEGLYTNRDLAAQVNDYVHEKGLRSYWIPYYRGNKDSWSLAHTSYRFDMTYIQPNYAFYMNDNTLYDKSIFKECCDAAKKYGLGLELEFETIDASSALHEVSPMFHQRLIDYLDAFEEYGVVADAGIAYYTGSQGMIDMAKSEDPVNHATMDRMADIVVQRQIAKAEAGVSPVHVGHAQIAYGGRGCIFVSVSDPDVKCYDISGRLVHTGSGMFYCNPGIYIVKSASGQSVKLQVK